MHDLDFTTLAKWVPDKNLLRQTFQSAACNSPATRFAASIQHLHSLITVPGFCFMAGEEWGISVVRAMNETGISNPDDKAVQQRASQIWDEYDLGGFDASRIDHFYEATGNAVTMATLPGRENTHSALHNFLKTLIVQAWGAIEVLAEELWKESLLQKPSLDTQTSWTNTERKLSGFSSRSKIANQYRFTFRQDNANILLLLDGSIFHSLAIVRNVIVHSNGVVDDDFVKDIAGYEVFPKTSPPTLLPLPELQPFKSLKQGDAIQFTGKLARDFIEPVPKLGFEIIKSIDEWLIRQP